MLYAVGLRASEEEEEEEAGGRRSAEGASPATGSS